MARRTESDRLARAHRAYQSGDFAGALRLYEPLLKRQPTAQVLERAGLCYGHLGRFDESYRALRRAAEMRPTVDGYCNLSVAAHMKGSFGKAHAAVDEALALDATSDDAVARKGNLLMLEGRAEEAYALLRPSAARDDLAPRVAVVFSRAAKAVGAAADAIAAVERCLAAEDRTPAERSDLLFALGDLRDAAGAYDDAFAAYEEANKLQPRRFDAQAYLNDVRRTVRVWSRDAYESAARSKIASDQPVFIVGMPRSGTSLVEQILASHPDVFGAGELGIVPDIHRRAHLAAAKRDAARDLPAALTSKDLDAYGRECLRFMTRRAKKAKRITDKMPDNVRHLGLIALMLPGARVIHCARDPLDTCLSCYFQRFAGAMQPFSYDLRDLGVVYRGYHTLIEHWREALDIPILDVAYEDLIDDQEGVSRRLVDFVGLDWDDACLRFHETSRAVITASTEQVRRPIYRSSVARHEHYAAHLQPLRDALTGQEKQPREWSW